MKTIEKLSIRKMNEKQVLQLIIDHKLISRAEISKISRLNKATVSSIVEELVQKDLITEVGIGNSQGGRKPIMFQFQTKAALSLSIEIGYNFISSVLTYLDGSIVAEQTEMLSIERSSIVDKLKAIIRKHQQIAPTTSYG